MFICWVERNGTILYGRVVELNEVIFCLCPSSAEIDSNMNFWGTKSVVVDTTVEFYVFFIARWNSLEDRNHLSKGAKLLVRAATFKALSRQLQRSKQRKIFVNSLPVCCRKST